jgi:hypothetical protein
MRYPLVLGIAAIGVAVLRFLLRRPSLPVVEDPHAPEEFLLQKQANLTASAEGGPVVDVAPVKPAELAVSSERHRELIAQTAYFLAKQRGFSPGREEDDWIVAEAMVGAGQAAPA